MPPSFPITYGLLSSADKFAKFFHRQTMQYAVLPDYALLSSESLSVIFPKLSVILCVLYFCCSNRLFLVTPCPTWTPTTISCYKVIVTEPVIWCVVFTIMAIFIGHVYLFTPIYKGCHYAQTNQNESACRRHTKLTSFSDLLSSDNYTDKAERNSHSNSKSHFLFTHFPRPLITLTSGYRSLKSANSARFLTMSRIARSRCSR